MPHPPVRIYCRLLRVLPPAFRREAEADMVAVFVAAHARVEARGLARRSRFWAATLADLAVTALAEYGAALPGLVWGHSGRSQMTMDRLLAATAADLRLAFRQLSKSPGWTLVASGTLALGLAATSIAAVLLRDIVLAPLPVPEADRLVRILEVSASGRPWWPSYPNAREWRAHGHRTFDAVAIVGTPRPLPVLLETEAVRATVAGAGAGMFDTLGVVPVVGRLFAADETAPGGAAVALVSERFWRGPLRARPLDGMTLTIEDELFTVVGVLPAAFRILGEGRRGNRAPTCGARSNAGRSSSAGARRMATAT
jgi:hypothetical protein